MSIQSMMAQASKSIDNAVNLQGEDETTAMGAFGLNAGEKVFQGITAVPDVVAEALVPDMFKPTINRLSEGNFGEAAYNTFVPGFAKTFYDPYLDEREERQVANPDQYSYTGEEQLTDFFNPEVPQSVQDRIDIAQEEHPIASAIGEGTGIAATFLGLRGGFNGRKVIQKPDTSTSAQSLPDGSPVIPAIIPGLKNYLNTVFSKFSNRIGGATEDASKTAVEGYSLASLYGGNELEMAAIGAGTQVAGSIALWAMPTSGLGAFKFFGSLAALTALKRFGQEFSPGENNMGAAVDSAFEHAKILLLTGLVAKISGTGRLNKNGDLMKNFPKIGDAITAIPRNTALNFFNDLNNDRNLGEVAAKLVDNPDYFGDTATRVFQNIDFTEEDASFAEAVEYLLENDRPFAQLYNNLSTTDSSN